MKVIIAGGRDRLFSASDIIRLNRLSKRLEIVEVVSGCALGIDLEGEQWAKSLNIPIRKFPADWSRHGRSAGFIRNAEMAQYADAVILFPGGKGTEHMYNVARSHKLIIHDWR